MKRTLFTLLTAMMALTALADTPAQRAFDAIKKLDGTWIMGSGTKTAKVVYKVTGGGSTVVETQFPGSPMEMVSVYHLDGPDRLLLTHYCAARNQPTMALLPGATATDFRFDFVSGTNMKPSDMHIHNVRYRLLADDHILTEWGGYMKGKPAGTEKFDLHRAKKA